MIKYKQEKGSVLLELLISMVIFSVLTAGILVPYIKKTKKEKEIEKKYKIKMAQRLLDKYVLDYDTLPINLTEIISDTFANYFNISDINFNDLERKNNLFRNNVVQKKNAQYSILLDDEIDTLKITDGWGSNRIFIDNPTPQKSMLKNVLLPDTHNQRSEILFLNDYKSFLRNYNYNLYLKNYDLFLNDYNQFLSPNNWSLSSGESLLNKFYKDKFLFSKPSYGMELDYLYGGLHSLKLIFMKIIKPVPSDYYNSNGRVNPSYLVELVINRDDFPIIPPNYASPKEIALKYLATQDILTGRSGPWGMHTYLYYYTYILGKNINTHYQTQSGGRFFSLAKYDYASDTSEIEKDISVSYMPIEHTMGVYMIKNISYKKYWLYDIIALD